MSFFSKMLSYIVDITHNWHVQLGIYIMSHTTSNAGTLQLWVKTKIHVHISTSLCIVRSSNVIFLRVFIMYNNFLIVIRKNNIIYLRQEEEQSPFEVHIETPLFFLTVFGSSKMSKLLVKPIQVQGLGLAPPRMTYMETTT